MNGFKTVIFGVSLALIGIFSNADMQAFVAAHLPAIAPFLGAIIIVLRAVTTSPIFTKKDD